MEIKPEDTHELLEFFSKNTYKAKDAHPTFNKVMMRCLQLFGMDYVYSVIPNLNGELSTNYPSSLVILERERIEGPISDNEKIECIGEEQDVFDLDALAELQEVSALENKRNGNGVHLFTSTDSNYVTNIGLTQESLSDPTKLKDLFSKARFARCRARFPVPVILFKKKHICRSATLSGGPEIYGRSSLDYFFSANNEYKPVESEQTEEDFMPSETQSDWQLFDRVRSQDIRLLKAFQVQTIVDLMVEKKKVKFGVNVTSSEKVDKEKRYAEFNLISLPYPGCEFFKQYRDNGYNGEDLIFEWNQGHVDADIFIPEDSIAKGLKMDWSQYRNWDLVNLTQNYLKLLLEYIRNESSGMLIHCISGWDRTPLFISLLRLSLWADGAVHKSLNAEQILYLTLAYDWLLFGHNLEDRLHKGEEILFFCFYFLKHITDHAYSVLPYEPELEEESSTKESAILSNCRNDSDIQLDGVLLEGDAGHTSPNSSSWSLNSSDSSRSSKSQDHPPSYFNVNQDSWEDSYEGIQQPAVLPTENCAEIRHSIAKPVVHTCSNIRNSSANSENQCSFKSEEPLSLNNSNLMLDSTIELNSQFSSSVTVGAALPKGFGRTSPVPVPKSTMHHVGTDSNSSASIGSWQLVTGLGSFREKASYSHPSSAYSHVSRSSVREGMECIDITESSCTLVDELNGRPSSNTFSCIQESVPQDRDSPVISPFQVQAEIDVFTHDNEISNGSCQRYPDITSRRKARLLAVQNHFDAVYACAIKRQSGLHVNEGSTGSGLSLFIGSIATKVGIRASGRNTS